MTNRELMAHLSKLDPDLPVMYWEEAWLCEVEGTPAVESVGVRHHSYVPLQPHDDEAVEFEAIVL